VIELETKLQSGGLSMNLFSYLSYFSAHDAFLE